MNGTDAIGGFPNLFGEALAQEVQNGTVSEAMLDDKLIRQLTTWFALDQAKLPEVDFERYVSDKKSKNVVRKVLESAITLLANSDEAGKGLPIGNVHDIARAY